MRKILIRQDPEELSRAAADLFCQIAIDSISERNSFSVALAGGSTPRLLYSLLAARGEKSSPDWRKVRFYFSDERNVPPDSSESNFRMASESLLRPLSIEPQNIFRWPTETDDAIIAAEEYQVVLENTGPLDLVLLGLGADAHTASLFPRTNALRETERLAVANRVEQLDTYRLTMTFPAINNAANIIFLVSGADKATAVKSVIEGEFNPDEYPAQGVWPKNGRLYWLLDEEAARHLESC